MAIVPTQATLIQEGSSVKLARYAQIIGGYAECAVYGVVRADDVTDDQCFRPWTKDQRDMVVFYLEEAQDELEEEIGFFLEPKWVVGTLAAQPNGDGRFVDDQPWKIPLLAKWTMVIEGGVRAEATIVEATAVSHLVDPTVTVVAMPVGARTDDVDEIRIFYPGTDTEIVPSAVTIAGFNVTVTIPRCRMVAADAADTGLTGIAYTTLANFQTTIDIKRIFNNPATNAVLVTPHSCTSSCLSAGCNEHTQTACIYIRDPIIGALDVVPATRTGGAWVSRGVTCCTPTRVRLNYRSGLHTLTKQATDSIRMLAHAKMPSPPCGCDILVRQWEKDNLIPSILTRSRINCPFGLSNGAWTAYKFAQRMKILRANTF